VNVEDKKRTHNVSFFFFAHGIAFAVTNHSPYLYRAGLLARDLFTAEVALPRGG